MQRRRHALAEVAVGDVRIDAREYPGSVAASVDTLLGALTSVDERARTAAPVLRLRRLTADLEFRSREGDGERDVGGTLATVQLELARVDADIADRYFGRSVAPPLHVA